MSLKTAGKVIGAGLGLTILWNVAFNDPEEARENLEGFGETTVSSGAGVVEGALKGLSKEAKDVLSSVDLDPDNTTPSDIADKISDKSGKIADSTKEFLSRLLENSGVELPNLDVRDCDGGEYAHMNPDCFKAPSQD